jgi:hypothetical protein
MSAPPKDPLRSPPFVRGGGRVRAAESRLPVLLRATSFRFLKSFAPDLDGRTRRTTPPGEPNQNQPHLDWCCAFLWAGGADDVPPDAHHHRERS